MRARVSALSLDWFSGEITLPSLSPLTPLPLSSDFVSYDDDDSASERGATPTGGAAATQHGVWAVIGTAK